MAKDTFTIREAEAEPVNNRDEEAHVAAVEPAATSDESGADIPAQSNELPAVRRAARRRPAGPPRGRIAANDDVPTIGGLIYALEQKPSTKPYQYAAIASGAWTALWLVFAWFMIESALGSATSFADFIVKSNALLVATAIVIPLCLFFFLALLAWRAEELRLRSSTMTEVAIRLAEPDRMAEQSIASLGQAVRRQVSFMNDAVGRTLGRAGELEALVHNEVSALERSYEENERKIRGLIHELAGERHALISTSQQVTDTLRGLSTEVPALIDKLATQQVTLSQVIDGAGHNLTALERAINQSAIGLEHSVNTSAGRLENALDGHSNRLQSVLEDYTVALGVALGSRTQQIQATFDEHARTIGAGLDQRTLALQSVFEDYGRALDTTLARRAEALDHQLVERTRTLDSAFSERLRLFDESILRSTIAIDGAVTERSAALSAAMEQHAKTMSATLAKQAGVLDETLLHGIESVRRTSETITRQSMKAIEGLTGQSELLQDISERLLGQINSATGRFEAQGSNILQAAASLESANTKIDSTLQLRHSELSSTLDRLSGKADEFGQFMQGYSSSIEGSIGEAERRARVLTDELRRQTEAHARTAVGDIERLKLTADSETLRALEDLRGRITNVSNEVSQNLEMLSTRFDATSEEVRKRAAHAAAEIAAEQLRLNQFMEQLPRNAQSSAMAIRQSLQDQLRAIEHMSDLTRREAAGRDIAPPLRLPSTTIASGPHADRAFDPTDRSIRPPEANERKRSLSTLTSGLMQELTSIQRSRPGSAEAARAAPGPPAQPLEAQADGRESWSLGDLLARASSNDRLGAHPDSQQQPSQIPPVFNVAQLARALDSATASAIWSKLRGGQRGIMVRSIYTAEGRATFDEVSRRFGDDSNFQATVNRYLADFERILRGTEQQDQSGRAAQAYANSETGRVYLFLAHASGRLS